METDSSTIMEAKGMLLSYQIYLIFLYEQISLYKSHFQIQLIFFLLCLDSVNHKLSEETIIFWSAMKYSRIPSGGLLH